MAIAIILLFAFPSKLFNSTIEEDYDEIRGWFRLPAPAVDTASSVSRTLTFMRFLDGPKVLAWSRPAWASLLVMGLFASTSC